MSFHLAAELPAAVDPDVFRAAFPGHGTFLLDGGGNASLDRFALMGAEPVDTLRVNRGDGDPFALLRTFLARHACEVQTELPFRAGAVGYIGYECGQMLERLPCIARPKSGLPDLAFAMHRWTIATSRADGRSYLSVVADSRAEAEATRTRILERLAGARPRPLSLAGGATTARLTREQYMDRVAQAKEHILAGDAFEICLTTSFSAPCNDAFALYRALRDTNAAPFAAFLDLPEGAVVSSSPERFLSLDRQRIAESRPIKGTRPRGRDAAEDDRLAEELASSEKDRAENAMIVDLVRNDLGRVSRIGSVEVPVMHAVERYATVHQLVSTIRGELAPEHDAFDLLRACFPPGSMTGAPKIEAMSILERLEPVERGVYSGAVGWIDVGGAFDFSVVIRAAVVKDGVATFGSGGAVVADSDPEDEWNEVMTKARAIVELLGRAPT